MFFSMLSISVLGADIASMEKYLYHDEVPVLHVFAALSPFDTLLYVVYVMLHWMCMGRKCFRELYWCVTIRN